MSQASVDVTGMKNTEQMPFDGMHDIAIMQVMEKCDLLSQLRLAQVSKRMNGLQLQVKNNVQKIQFRSLSLDARKLIVQQLGDKRYDYDSDDEYNDDMPFGALTLFSERDLDIDRALSRLALNTHAKSVELIVDGESHYSRDILVIDKLFNFPSESLTIRSPNLQGMINLPQLDLPKVLQLSKNFRLVAFDNNSLTPQDLCLLRKMIMEGNCKMNELRTGAIPEKQAAFLKECLGVTLVDYYNENTRSGVRAFQAEDESVELYAVMFDTIMWLHHFEGEIETSVAGRTINFRKREGGAKPDPIFKKVVMDLPYAYAKEESEEEEEDEGDDDDDDDDNDDEDEEEVEDNAEN